VSEVRIYKLDLTAGDIAIAHSTVFWPTSHGGSDTPDANYPELSKSENIFRDESAGALGQHVLDATLNTDYATSQITLCELGPLAQSQYDCRGGTPLGHGPLKCRWRQFFSSNALAETGVGYPLVMVHGMGGGTDHPTASGNVFLEIQALQDAGANFDWFCRYRKVNGTSTTLTGTNITGSADVADDAEHECIVTIVPSTVTGAYLGTGFLGSAVVASDGAISMTVDGTTVLSATGLQFVINHLATTNPEVYYGRGLWHGIM
jgi:hypothetical protein